MIPFHVEENMTYKNHKMITLDPAVYATIHTPITGSYNILMARLFGLSYANFCRMARDNYNATLHGKNGGYITITFENTIDANRFQMELVYRWFDLMKNNKIQGD